MALTVKTAMKSKRILFFYPIQGGYCLLQMMHFLISRPEIRYHLPCPVYCGLVTIDMLTAASALPVFGAPRARAACDSRTTNHHNTNGVPS
jgi:hypothetical protein